MRIGEWGDSVGRQFAARHEAMVASMARLAEELAAPLPAVPPAVALADAVHISPEARSAHLHPGPAEPRLVAPPSPGEVAAALRDLAGARTSAAASAAAERLANLVRLLAHALPAWPSHSVPSAPEAAAAELVRRLLAPPTRPPASGEVARLLLELLSASSPVRQVEGRALLSPVLLERAAAAILAAVIRGHAGGSLAAPQTAPGPESVFPPALLGLFGADAAISRPRPPGRRRRTADQDRNDRDEPEQPRDAPRSRGSSPQG